MDTFNSLESGSITKLPTNTPNYAAGRRAFLGTLGLGAAGVMIMAGTTNAAYAQAAAPSAADVFNFALNFEYLGAEFYLHAVNGSTLELFPLM